MNTTITRRIGRSAVLGAAVLISVLAVIPSALAGDTTGAHAQATRSTEPSVGLAPVARNGRIAYQSEGDIYTMNADGTDRRRLTDHPAPDSNPSFSPDGSIIAFVSDRDGNAEIYTMNADGDEEINRTNNSADDLDPAFSPDGKQIVFSSYRGEDGWKIYMMDVYGSGEPDQLTFGGMSDSHPAFSPNGRQIVFDRGEDDGTNIYVMNNVAGDEPRPLTATGMDYDPTFSPDGSTIAFTSYRDGNAEIYEMVVAEPRKLTNLTLSTSQDWQPTFSPNGDKIAFTRDDGEKSLSSIKIYVMNADGTKPIKISGLNESDAPSWGGVPPRLTIADNTMTEPDWGTTRARFTVALSSPSSSPVTVNYGTQGWSAWSPSDYTAKRGKLTFPPGITQMTVSVDVVGDTDDESEEIFHVKLFEPTNASIEDDTARGVIRDNDVWVKVWLNAFIPKDIPKVTMPVPAGPYAGQTMIPGPVPGVGNCFLTDQRGFSGDSHASKRIQSWMVIDPKKAVIIQQGHYSDETIEVDCEDGLEECKQRAVPAANAKVSRVTRDHVEVSLSGAASNPCILGPPIDYTGTLFVERGSDAVKVDFDGLVESFPNFEMYVTGWHGNDRKGKMMFQEPYSGTLWDLWGEPNIPVVGSSTVTED